MSVDHEHSAPGPSDETGCEQRDDVSDVEARRESLPTVTRLEVDGDEYALVAFEIAPTNLPESVTEAEREVAELVLQAMTNAEIARRRGTSPSTVANQLRSLYRKMDVGSRTELIRELTRH